MQSVENSSFVCVEASCVCVCVCVCVCALSFIFQWKVCTLTLTVKTCSMCRGLILPCAVCRCHKAVDSVILSLASITVRCADCLMTKKGNSFIARSVDYAGMLDSFL